MSSAPNSNDEPVAPWADLLPEVCDHVLDRLDAVGVIRFPAACAAWAAASKPQQSTPPRLRSGWPTLLTSGLDPDGYDVEYDLEAGAFGLHDVATGKSFYGDAPRLKNRTWVGGKDDWLVTTDMTCGVELLNPVTGDTVPLPPFTTIRGLEVAADYYELHVAVNNQVHHLQKVTLCRTPAHPNGYLAVALFSSGSMALVAFAAAAGDDGDDNGWTILKNPEGVHYLRFTDVTVHNGKVLAVADSGNIYSWDMEDGADHAGPTVMPGPDVGHVSHDLMRGFFLVAASSSGGGRLQVVCVYGHGAAKNKRGSRRVVFKDQWSFCPRRASLHELDAGAGTWRRVRDLGGDRALFVGDNYPFYAAVPPGGGGGSNKDLQADCVYVADVAGCDAAAFDLKLGDEHGYDFDRRLIYPAMGDSLQMPMWFRPTAHPIAEVPVEE
ncbi:unnamed protein product [Urochloa humidicola]